MRRGDPRRIEFEVNVLSKPLSLFSVTLALVAALIFWPFAQADETARPRLDAARAALVEIDAALKTPDLSDADLLRLRSENDPLAGELQSIIADLSPRLAASSKRLDELTPKDKAAPPGNDPAGEEFAAEKKINAQLDADIRAARAFSLQSDEFNARIGAARRNLFAQQTFQRSSSLLSPVLWVGAMRELPHGFATIKSLFGDWLSSVKTRVAGNQAAGFVGVLLALLVLAPLLRVMTRRVIARDPKVASPSRLYRALAAIWTIAVLMVLPLSALAAIGYALDYFDISDPRLQGLQDALFDGLRLVIVANALGRGWLAPGNGAWRLPAIGDRPASLLFGFWIIAAAIIGLEKFIEPLADAAGSLNIAIAARGAGAMLVALAMLHTLRQMAPPDIGAPQTRSGLAPGRMIAWLLVAAILGAVLAGYVAFAIFILGQMMYIAAFGVALYLIDTLVQEGLEALLDSEATSGRSLMRMTGLNRGAIEQIGVLAQGFTRLAVVIAAIVLLVAPWGIQSQDMFGNLRAAYFGFKIGDVSISLSTIFAAAGVFMLAVVATRAMQGWLGARFLPRTRLDAGMSNSIRTIFGYVGVAIALLLGSAQLGIDFQKLAIVAGALSVGIGFGLQSIVNNFVSGLILLWERSIRVGDRVIVGADQGYVRRINARATEIETLDRVTLIVPNSILASGAVKNWVRSDRVARIVIAVNVAFESEAEVARALLIDAAKAQSLVMSIPAPMVLFDQFGEWALKFQLICFVDDVEMVEKVRSELNFDILRRMGEAKLRVPYPK